MKIALQSRLTHCRPGSRFDLIGLANVLQVSGVELVDDRTIPTEQLTQIRVRLADAGIELVSLHVTYCCTAKNDPSRSGPLEAARQGLERAAQLGARTIAFIGQSSPTCTVEQNRASYVDMVTQLLPDADRLGLKPTVNNSGLYADCFGQAEYFRQLCGQFSERVGLTFDVGNWLLAREEVLDAVEQLAPWIDVVHLKDWTIQPGRDAVRSGVRSGLMSLRRRVMSSFAGDAARSVARTLGISRHIPRLVRGMDGTWYSGAVIGEGLIDHAACIRALDRCGFAGYLCVEYEGTGDLITAYRRGVERMQQVLSTIDVRDSPPRRGCGRHGSTQPIPPDSRLSVVPAAVGPESTM